MDSPSPADCESSSGSPNKFKIAERISVWLEDLFVKTPTHTFQIFKDKFEEIIGNLYRNNDEIICIMPKEILVRSLEKLAYRTLFLEPDDTTKVILEQTGIILFNDSSEFKFMEDYDHYLAACFICNNISELSQDVLLENIFKPQNHLVKFFVNEIAEQNKNSPVYAMWDKVLYYKLFPSVKENTSQENLSDFEISAAIQKATHEIQVARPENAFNSVQNYLQLCKKYNRLDIMSYQSILSSLLYKLVIADLQSTKTETSEGKLLRYSTFYQSLLLKTVFFEGETGSTKQEFRIISNIRDLVEEVKIKMDDIYLSSDKDIEWLERDGVYLAACVKHLSEKIVFKYLSVFNKLPYNGGFKLIYAERIYTYFIKPILNSTADEGMPAIDHADFFNLFISVTQYMYDTQQNGISHDSHYTRKILFLTENEWKGLRMWLEPVEENGRSVVTQAFENYEADNQGTTKNNGLLMELC